MKAKPLHFSKNNSILLNVIRFVSAELVVLAHIEEYFPSANLTLLRNAGNFSVGLFFILSGMLIATSAWNKRIKSADYGFKAFFLDRFSRIYAALVPALAIVFLTDYLNFKIFDVQLINIDLQTLAGNLLMLQEYPLIDHATYIVNKPWFDEFRFSFFGSDLPLWTLAIEWWLYLFFGWIALVKFKLKRKWIFIALLLAVVPVYQLIIGSRMGPGVPLIWFFGVGMAHLLKQEQKHFMFLKSTISIFAFTILFGVLYWFDYWFLAVFAFGIALYGLLCVLQQKRVETNSSKFQVVINFLADYSFTLYLVHYSLLGLLTNFISFNAVWIDIIVLFLIVNIVSILVAEPFEKKHKLIRKYLGSRFSA
jgi:peptidoglycan/LPS O-acetylase OafA/YrhL